VRPATLATTPRWKPAHRRHLRDTLRLVLVFAHDQVFAHNRNGTVTYVCNCYSLTEDQLFVADNVANNIDMLRTHPRVVFVRNFDKELDNLLELVQAYFAFPEYARGVIEGIDHFGSCTAVPG
jgi:Sucrose-6F-phosphate phosphohydrolase